MNWQIWIHTFTWVLEDTDFSILTQPEIAAAIVVLYLAIFRKRGAITASLFSLFSTTALVVTWDRMGSVGNAPFQVYYFTAFLCIGSLVVLYVLYLYALREQVE